MAYFNPNNAFQGMTQVPLRDSLEAPPAYAAYDRDLLSDSFQPTPGFYNEDKVSLVSDRLPHYARIDHFAANPFNKEDEVVHQGRDQDGG